MTPDDEKLIQEIAGLEAKRTPGNWMYCGSQSIADTGDYTDAELISLATRKDTLPDGTVIEYEDKEKTILGYDEWPSDADGEFMALAPAMARIIRTQQARIAELEDALRVERQLNDDNAKIIDGLNDMCGELEGEKAALTEKLDAAYRKAHEGATVTSAGAAKYAVEWASMRQCLKDILGIVKPEQRISKEGGDVGAK